MEQQPFAGEGAGSYRRVYRVRLQFHPVHKYPKVRVCVCVCACVCV